MLLLSIDWIWPVVGGVISIVFSIKMMSSVNLYPIWWDTATWGVLLLTTTVHMICNKEKENQGIREREKEKEVFLFFFFFRLCVMCAWVSRDIGYICLSRDIGCIFLSKDAFFWAEIHFSAMDVSLWRRTSGTVGESACENAYACVRSSWVFG